MDQTPDTIPVVVLATGAVEYLPAEAWCFWFGNSLWLKTVESILGGRPVLTSRAPADPLVLEDGRAVALEGWQDEALRLRRQLARAEALLRPVQDAARELQARNATLAAFGDHLEGEEADRCRAAFHAVEGAVAALRDAALATVSASDVHGFVPGKVGIACGAEDGRLAMDARGVGCERCCALGAVGVVDVSPKQIPQPEEGC